MVRIEKVPGMAFLAFPDMKNFLTSELAGRFAYGKIVEAATASGFSFAPSGAFSWYGDLLYCPDFEQELFERAGRSLPYFSRSCMQEPFIVRFGSINEAACALREIQRNWAGCHFRLFRRTALIQDKLPYINLKSRAFPAEIPDTPMGLFTLLDEKTMLASALTNSPLPAGSIRFEEDHENPPSRAYLKLQEALVLFRTFFGADFPKAGDKCLDAGACPGGWTWVMRSLGAEVLAVDRTELAPDLMSDGQVRFLEHDAFTLRPEDVCEIMECGRLDWLLSDVICYPARLLEWIRLWLEKGLARNIICTIKMQGIIDWSLISEFKDIPDSKIVHLNYNKHELTIMIRNLR